jgi:capsular exopolysaccharide synthesis family protein
MEIRDYLRGLRRHWLAIFLMTLVGLGAGYGWTVLQTPVYEASASGFVASRQTEDVGMSTIGDGLARSKVQSYLDIAGWRNVAEHAIEELDLQTTPEELVTRVAVTNTPDTVILKIVAQGPSPVEARALAEAWIEGMVVAIDEIEGTGEPGTSPVTVIPGDSASLPSAPVFPDVQTAVIVGGVLGLGFGIAFALTRTVSDRRIRLTDDVEGRVGLPVVGTLPLAPGQKSDSRVFDTAAGKGVGFAVAEAMRSLRTNLQFMDVDNPPRVIVVTSPLPGDGKSTVACNLALTLAAAGSKVVLIDGDLRRSTVGKSMGLPEGAGLSDVLAGRAELVDVLQVTPQAKNLVVLTAGSVPPNPSEVLGSGRMRKLLSELAVHATVIIDAPPLLPVTDGAVLTHQADGALLVATAGKSTYDLVDRALDTLRKANGRALGLVLNKAPLRGVDSSAYSYEYRREYADTSATHVAAQGADRKGQETPGLDIDDLLNDALGSSGKQGERRGRREPTA